MKCLPRTAFDAHTGFKIYSSKDVLKLLHLSFILKKVRPEIKFKTMIEHASLQRKSK